MEQEFEEESFTYWVRNRNSSWGEWKPRHIPRSVAQDFPEEELKERKERGSDKKKKKEKKERRIRIGPDDEISPPQVIPPVFSSPPKSSASEDPVQSKEETPITTNVASQRTDPNSQSTSLSSRETNSKDTPKRTVTNGKSERRFEFVDSGGGGRPHLYVDDNVETGEDDLSDMNGITYLDVGGTVFATTTSTLRHDPNSMLYAMFSGMYKSKKDHKGAYFIDRDGHYFRYILNYLRDGSVDLMDNEFELKQLLREAEYYQIEGLIEDIREALEALQKGKGYDNSGEYAVVYLGGYGKSAQIYTKDTGGGFTESCITLNKLATEGYHIEGVASGANGHYYAILRTRGQPNTKNIFSSNDKRE